MQAQAIRELSAETERLRALINSPITEDFDYGVPLEATHQVERWGTAHDAGKGPEDWFWLVGYLAGKCLRAHLDGDTEKALHHTISTAAALRNWHRAIKGANDMRPALTEKRRCGRGAATRHEDGHPNAPLPQTWPTVRLWATGPPGDRPRMIGKRERL